MGNGVATYTMCFCFPVFGERVGMRLGVKRV